jgi:hypothetical protein
LCYPCELLPDGQPGVLTITAPTRRGPVSADYTVSVHFDDRGHEVGYQLVHQGNHNVYDISTEWGLDQWECDCGDCLFRSRLCKHSRGLQQALRAVGLLPEGGGE